MLVDRDRQSHRPAADRVRGVGGPVRVLRPGRFHLVVLARGQTREGPRGRALGRRGRRRLVRRWPRNPGRSSCPRSRRRTSPGSADALSSMINAVEADRHLRGVVRIQSVLVEDPAPRRVRAGGGEGVRGRRGRARRRVALG